MTSKLSVDDDLKKIKKVISYFIVNFDNPEGSRLKLAIQNLFREIERELNRFISGRNDLTAMSLQVRNLFELYLITKHIYTTEDGLNDWFGQLHKDSIDIQNGFIELFEKHNKNVTELQEIKSFTELSLDESPFIPKGSFNIKVLAERYGYKKEYAAIHKICSKLIHPTSLKINSYIAFTEDKTYLSLLEIFGVLFCKKIECLSYEISKSKPQNPLTG